MSHFIVYVLGAWSGMIAHSLWCMLEDDDYDDYDA